MSGFWYVELLDKSEFLYIYRLVMNMVFDDLEIICVYVFVENFDVEDDVFEKKESIEKDIKN